LRVSRQRQNGFAPNFFQGLRENTCSIQPALKSNAPGLIVNPHIHLRSEIEVSSGWKYSMSVEEMTNYFS